MKTNLTFRILSIIGFAYLLSFSFSCSNNSLFRSEALEDFAGFHIRIYFEDDTEDYFVSSEVVTRKNLLEILTEMSLAENPSMRFITTNSTIEIYDILGTRNTLTMAWKIFVNDKEIDPTLLKKGVEVNWKSKIEFKFMPYTRIKIYSEP